MRAVVRISDGLGNQLFQYAFGYAYAKKRGCKLLLDPLFWGTSLRKYQLEEFNIAYNERFVNKVWDYVLGFGPRNGRKFKALYREWKIERYYHIEQEKHLMEYDSSIFDLDNNTFFQGFWQTPLYFDEYYEEIKKQFTYKGKLSSKAQKYENDMKKKVSVSLHIRRTDYNREVNNVCLNERFYECAISEMEQRIGEFKLYIFTDDKEFVKETFHLHDYTIVEGIEDIEEFVLMQACKHHIIANSTFSWWGAYLAENKGGIVYAPLADIWTKEFYPKEWNMINAAVGK